MKKKGSKILGLLLAVVLVFDMVPITTYAAEPEISQISEEHGPHKVCVNADAHDGNCTHDEITQWQELDESQWKIETSGNYYLSKDITRSSDITIAAGQDVVICLNGHTCNISNFFKIEENATLRICDCSADETGVVNGGIYGSGESWHAELYSGTVTRVAAEWKLDYTFNMYGGKINNPSSSGVAVGISQMNNQELTGSVNIYGGEIIAGSMGIRVAPTAADAEVNIYGGTITVENDTMANGIRVEGKGTLNISGGKISSARAGVSVAGQCNVNISGNADISARYFGLIIGGSSATTNPKLTIAGSPKISATDETSAYAIQAYNTIDIKGAPVITGGVYSTVTPMFTLTGELTNTTPIPVTIQNKNYVITSGWDTYMPGKTTSNEVAKYFNAVTSGYGVRYKESEVVAVQVTPAIVFSNGNVISSTSDLTSATLATTSYYSSSYYKVNVYDSLDATEVSQKVSGKVAGYNFTLSSLNDSSLEGGTYYVALTYTGKEESARVPVVVEAAEINVPEKSEVPTIDTLNPGTLTITNDSSSEMEFGLKVVDPNGVVIQDWIKWDALAGDSDSLCPLDAGEYSVYFCYIDAMEEGNLCFTDFVC